MPWRLIVRQGPRVQRLRFDELDAALAALESHARQLTTASGKSPVDLGIRRFEPAAQVAARVELCGPQRLLPSVCAGIDVHGDGSTQPYLGRVRRRPLAQRRGETPYQSLRRALAR